MSTTLLPPSDDNTSDAATVHLESRKQKTIKPLGKTATSGDMSIPRASDELLDELRKKTAALAAEIGGRQHIKKDEDKIIEELKVKTSEQNDLAIHESSPELPTANPAASIVREKLERLFVDEPDAQDEILELKNTGSQKSVHQDFMEKLVASGLSVADIQTKWHTYYVNLPEADKHEVWLEFYANQAKTKQHRQRTIESERHQHHRKTFKAKQHSVVPPQHPFMHHTSEPAHQPVDLSDIKSELIHKINAGGKLTPKHHLKSLLFGLSMSGFVVLTTSFVFFNEAYLAPFISPGRTVSATPIIGTQSGEIGDESKIIIPKINLEVPVVFDLNSVEEKDIQHALEDGVVHYASTPKPGETGNTVIVGHSSNNIFNNGKYKFAFVLLKRLEAEDTFFVHKGGVRYTYKVYKKEIVAPNSVSVLATQERPNTITLITCDPPGTSVNRLIITAEQISPDTSTNIESTVEPTTDVIEQLPSNAPSLWSRVWPF